MQMVECGQLQVTNLHPKLMDVDPTSPERLLGYSIIIPAYNEGATSRRHFGQSARPRGGARMGRGDHRSGRRLPR